MDTRVQTKPDRGTKQSMGYRDVVKTVVDFLCKSGVYNWTLRTMEGFIGLGEYGVRGSPRTRCNHDVQSGTQQMLDWRVRQQ